MENDKQRVPLVSVLMITYNHEKYIKQALDGILTQKVNFDYEIIIGEDCSKDKTRIIIEEYKKKFPKKIKLILYNQNVGINNNLNKVISEARGKYIATCEGDDYWINPMKLQKQVEFLEKNSEFVGTAHKFICVDEKNNTLKIEYRGTYTTKEIYTLQDAINWFMPGQTATLVYRNIFIENPLDWNSFIECDVIGDRKIAFYLSLYGDFYCFKEIMSHYRVVTTQGDSWSAQSHGKNLNLIHYDYFTELANMAKKIKNIDIDFKEQYLNCGYLSFRKFFWQPTKENFRIFKEIIKKYDNSFEMGSFIMKKIFKKYSNKS